MFILDASKSNLTVRQRELMASGSVNVNTVKFEFSADRDGLTRTAVFRNDAENRSILLDDTNQCEIPREVLSSAGQRVYAGVYGTRGQETVLPTIWASLGVVLAGAAPDGGTYPPTPELWEQELAKKQDKLHGEPGQLVGFDESGNAVAQDAGEALQGPPGPQGVPGEDGKSAYQIAVDGGFEGTEEEWLESLQGPPGHPGKDGADGSPGPAGADGKSAYQIAVDNGYTGTEAEWLASLKGDPGPQGASGKDGEQGLPGADGADGPPGADGTTFTPSVSADGTLSWTNDGNLPNPASVNIKGPAGQNGADGTDGENGVGVPTGGAAGQILSKKTAADYDTQWIDAPQNGGGLKPQIIVSVETGVNVTATKGATSVSAVSESGAAVLNIPEYGSWTVTAYKGGKEAFETVFVDTVKQYQIELTFINIYGVSWNGSRTTKWARTDKAALFTDPVPYVAGATSYGSPFDTRQPWAGMTRENRTGGVMVKVPKFWYKLTQNGAGLKIQIADAATEGFVPSPMHMDRGDGKGERDVAYIGRYHCASDFKSKTGIPPKKSVTRAGFRTGIHDLGENVWQGDFAMRFTLWLLYLVEFADWDGDTALFNYKSTGAMGYTDAMPYHTGTPGASGDNAGGQYRNIEGLADMVVDFCDGCYFDASGLHIILNPNDFSDSSGGAVLGAPRVGFPSAFTVNSNCGFPAFYPSLANGGLGGPVPDEWRVSTGSAIWVGAYSSDKKFGMLYIESTGASNSGTAAGSRLMELPDNEVT